MNISRFQRLTLLALLLGSTSSAQLWPQESASAMVFAKDQAHTHTSDLNQVTAAIPNAFSYQGTLRMADGTLANGAFTITLRLYTNVVGGTPLFEQPFNAVAVRDGLFNVVVGDDPNHVLPAGLFDNNQLFLGITVDPDSELLPRQRLHPVPWAMQASTAAIANTLVPTGWTPNAIRYIGNSRQGRLESADYPMDLRRLVVEAKDAGATPTSVDIPDSDLVRLCADEDGCDVRLGMRNQDANQDGSDLLTVGFPYHFSLGKTNNGQRLWRSVGFDDKGLPIVLTGVDGGNGSQNVISTGDCRFSDGFMLGGVDRQDTEPAFTVLNWHGNFDSANAVCVLVIND